MTITAALVLFSVIWFMTFLCVLPVRLRTQGDAGEVVPGTHKGAPHEPMLVRKAWITTAVAVVLFAAAAFMIVWGPIGVDDLDVFGRPGADRGASD